VGIYLTPVPVFVVKSVPGCIGVTRGTFGPHTALHSFERKLLPQALHLPLGI